MDGSQEEAVEVRKVGFPANHVKMIRKEQNLVVEKTHQRVVKGDVGQHVLLVKHIKEGRVQDELD